MNEFFYHIVELFKQICKITDLTYEELNILVYCLFIPFSWLLIGVIRTRKHWNLLIINLLVIVFFLFYRQKFTSISNIFYTQNIKFLEFLGDHTLQGYIYISVLMGVLIPFFMYFALFRIGKKYLYYLIFSYFLGLSLYFLIVFL